jgi:hypothetical protein
MAFLEMFLSPNSTPLALISYTLLIFTVIMLRGEVMKVVKQLLLTPLIKPLLQDGQIHPFSPPQLGLLIFL